MYQSLNSDITVKAWCKVCSSDTQKFEEANTTSTEAEWALAIYAPDQFEANSTPTKRARTYGFPYIYILYIYIYMWVRFCRDPSPPYQDGTPPCGRGVGCPPPLLWDVESTGRSQSPVKPFSPSARNMLVAYPLTRSMQDILGSYVPANN